MAVQSTDLANPLIRLLPSLPAGTGSLNVLAPLIGRRSEMAAIRHLLVSSDARLVVITGPSGVGKTRLAAAIADNSHDDFPDGVVIVNLAQIRTSSLVLPAIATALDIHERTEEELRDAVFRMLEQRAVLLVLDNFEHVNDAAPLLNELLGATTNLTILVTSRVVLGVYGEHVYPVPPMPVPEVGQVSHLDAVTVQTFEAVQLFVDRARSVDPNFRLRDEDAGQIMHIVRQLDGLPLAIELAASRIRSFTLAELASKLERRLAFLVSGSGSRSVPNRLSTMRDAIAWSYDLLSPTEQAVFRRLALIIGTWTIDDAVAISRDTRPALEEQAARIPDVARTTLARVATDKEMAADWMSSPARVTLSPPSPRGVGAGPSSGEQDEDDLATRDLVSSLVDKSLIRHVGGMGDLPHFNMLETLREFGLEQLAQTGESDSAVSTYAWHMLDLAEEAEPQLTGVDQVRWLDRLTEMHADLRVAFHWFLAHEPVDLALRIATAVWRFGYTRGHISENLAWIESALIRATGRTALRADALNAAGVLVNMQGDVDRAEHLHQEALDIALEAGHAHAVGMAFLGLGEIAVANGNYEDAQWMVDEADKVLNQSENQRTLAVAKTNLGNLLWSMGALDRATTVHAESKVLYEAIGDERGIAWAVTNIGRIAAERQDYGAAVKDLQVAIRLYDNLDDRSGIAEALEALADVANGTGDQLRAATLLGAADALRILLDHPVPAIDAIRYQHLLTAVKANGRLAFDRGWNQGQTLSPEEAMAIALEIVVPVSASATSSLASFPARRAVSHATGPTHALTGREMEVLRLLRSGKADRDISGELFIGIRTVQTHVARILAKLGVNSRSAAVARAIRDGLI